MKLFNSILIAISVVAIVFCFSSGEAVAKYEYECAVLKDAEFVDGKNGYCWYWIVKQSTGKTISLNYNWNLKSQRTCKEWISSNWKRAEFYCPRIP